MIFIFYVARYAVLGDVPPLFFPCGISPNVHRYTKFSELKARKIWARGEPSPEPYIALLGEGLPRLPICKFINNERGKSAATP